MGSRKISSLPVASIDGTEELLVNDSGTSKKVTISNAVNSVVDVSGATVGGDLSGTVSNAQLTANSVGTSEIVDGSVTAAKLDTTYESADADIQTHITASHAPSDANNYTLPSSVVHDSELSSSTSSTSTSTGANSAAVKAAYDKGNHSHSYLGDSDSRISGWDDAAAFANGVDDGDNVLNKAHEFIDAFNTLPESLNLANELAGKVDDSQVLTDVPTGAVFSDTTYSVGDNGLSQKNFTTTLKSKLDGIETGATGDQTQSDINGLGITATGVDLGNWTLTESAGVLYFATGGTNKMKLDASGNLTVVGDVTAFGTI